MAIFKSPHPPNYKTFQEIAELKEIQQQKLLDEGDSLERVWAAWALGLKISNKAVPDLVNSSEKKPDAGLRLHLIIILAGFGELWFLKNLAQNDPDAEVRAAACQYLIYTISKTDTESLELINEILKIDSSNKVKHRILISFKKELGRLPIDIVITNIFNPDSYVNKAALAQITDCYSPNELFPNPLSSILGKTLAKDFKMKLVNWCVNKGYKHLVIKIALYHKQSVMEELLDVLKQNGVKYEFKILEELTKKNSVKIDTLLLFLLGEKDTAEGVAWKINILSRMVNYPKIRNRYDIYEYNDGEFFFKVLDQFILALKNLQNNLLVKIQISDLISLLEFFKRELQTIKNGEFFIDYEYDFPEEKMQIDIDKGIKENECVQSRIEEIIKELHEQ